MGRQDKGGEDRVRVVGTGMGSGWEGEIIKILKKVWSSQRE